MKPKRKIQARSASAQVISLAAYRDAHRKPAAPQPASYAQAYWQWLALAGSMWSFWW